MISVAMNAFVGVISKICTVGAGAAATTFFAHDTPHNATAIATHSAGHTSQSGDLLLGKEFIIRKIDDTKLRCTANLSSGHLSLENDNFISRRLRRADQVAR
jgi:hypothetical protein